MKSPIHFQRPSSADAVQDLVRQSLSNNSFLHIFGGNSKSRLGRRIDGPSKVDMSGLNELVSYEPGELVMVVQPGMRLSAVEQLLDHENQQLAFEPPHWGPDATVGGTVACNLSGPRRFKAGALRDHLLGVELVNGHGERVRSGGKVVKNVTGYDLSKIISGSFGTLGIMTEICLRVWPRSETQKTLVVYDQDPAAALESMLEFAASPCEITGLSYLPKCDGQPAQTFARLEGSAPSLVLQLKKLGGSIEREMLILEEGESMEYWKKLRELEFFRPTGNEQLWRFSLPPSKAAGLLDILRLHGARRFGFDWGGGLLFVLMPQDVEASLLHQNAIRHGGVAWRFASDEQDCNDAAFTPLSAGEARMNRILKEAFDPKRIFNPSKI